MPTALRVRDGASHLRFDERRAESVSGTVQLQTDDYATASDRYEIEVRGGASGLTVTAAR